MPFLIVVEILVGTFALLIVPRRHRFFFGRLDRPSIVAFPAMHSVGVITYFWMMVVP